MLTLGRSAKLAQMSGNNDDVTKWILKVLEVSVNTSQKFKKFVFEI